MVQPCTPCCTRERDDGKVTIYWDKPIKTDRKVSCNKADKGVIEDNTWCIMGFVISIDHHVKEKEEGKIYKYMYLAAEIRRQFRLKIVIVLTILGALGRVPAKLPESPPPPPKIVKLPIIE